MLLPTKGISAERALLTIGAEILEEMRSPLSVSALWERFNRGSRQARDAERITFDWFSLALATLYALNLIEWTANGYLRRANVP